MLEKQKKKLILMKDMTKGEKNTEKKKIFWESVFCLSVIQTVIFTIMLTKFVICWLNWERILFS